MCVAFSIKFAKTNQKFAENSEFCEKNSLLFKIIHFTPYPTCSGLRCFFRRSHRKMEVRNEINQRESTFERGSLRLGWGWSKRGSLARSCFFWERQTNNIFLGKGNTLSTSQERETYLNPDLNSWWSRRSSDMTPAPQPSLSFIPRSLFCTLSVSRSTKW